MRMHRGLALLCLVLATLCVTRGPALAAFPTKLFLSHDGLALSSLPSRQVLTRAIEVTRTSGHTSANWTASSDQTWLTVTASGKTGGKLTVSADPQGLTPDQFYSANVTVTTDKADFTDSETLRVGLWIGSLDAATVTVNDVAVNAAANPVTPVFYAVTTDGTSIHVFNVYTGALVTTFQNVATMLGDLEVSSDGTTLFVADLQHFQIVAMNANTGAVLHRYPLGFTSNPDLFNFAYARPYGQPAFFIPGSPDEGGVGQIVSYPSGTQLAKGILPDIVAVPPDGRTVVDMETHVSPGNFDVYSVKPSGSALALTTKFHKFTQELNCADIAISNDSKRIYIACGQPYEFDAYDTKTGEQVQTLPADAYPNNVEIDSNDHLVGSIFTLYGKHDTFIYNQKGFPLKRLKGSLAQWEAQTRVSGDATRVITLGGLHAIIRSM